MVLPWPAQLAQSPTTTGRGAGPLAIPGHPARDAPAPLRARRALDRPNPAPEVLRRAYLDATRLPAADLVVVLGAALLAHQRAATRLTVNHEPPLLWL